MHDYFIVFALNVKWVFWFNRMRQDGIIGHESISDSSIEFNLSFSFVADLTPKLAAKTLISTLQDEIGMKLGQIHSGHVFSLVG